MAENARQTCSECGAILSESSKTVPPRCECCLNASPNELSPAPKSPGGQSGQTAPLAASARTVILGSDGDTDPNQALTVDFVPSADPTEPTVHASDDRVAKKELVGRFKIISILGRGTFGTVYRAYDPLLDREVALKVPRFAADDREMMERFHREAKAAARLHHPNIVTLYENGQTDEGPYLVNEFVNGVPLSQMLRENRPDLRTAVDWARQIAEGLHYAHTEGIVHRDVKPANVMLNVAGRPQIMDFGLAKRSGDIESGMTMEGQIVGTPNYMSPEQARGSIAEIGPHSDQYSVGVVLYEMLCGRPPFAGNPWTIIARVANVRELPPAPRSVKPDLPRDLEACCLKAMEKEPHARYPSLQVLADDLDHWLKGLPLVARPIGPTERFTRWCRHNRMIASLGGTLAVILLVAGIVGPWLAVQFRNLANVAKHKADEAELARDDEKKARLATEQSIIDTYTETGLTADRNGDPREAILWFANAVAAAENHPQREKHNRIRVRSWLSEIAIPVQAFEQPSEWMKSLAYHPSGRLLLSLPLSGRGELLRLSDGKRSLLPTSELVNAAIWSPDGTLLVLASGQEVVVREFDVDRTTHPELDRWTHPDAVSGLQFSADGKLLVVGGEKTVQVRDLSKKEFRIGPLDVGSQVSAIAISRDGRRFAVQCVDQKVRVFSSASDQPSSEPLLPVLPSASYGSLSPMFVGNDRLVVVDDYHAIRCWNIDQKNLVWEQEIQRVLSSAISPDEKWIALGEDFDVVLLDAQSGKPAEKRLTHPNLIACLGFHPQSSLLLTGSEDHSARLFEVPSGKPVGPPMPHNKAVHRIAWSPEGTSFATVHWGGEVVRVWKRNEPQLPEFVAADSARSPFVRLNDRKDRWLPSGFNNSRSRVELEVLDAASGRAIGSKLSGPGVISDADFVCKSSFVVLAGGGRHEDAGQPLEEQKLDDPGFVRFVNSETGTAAFEDMATPSQPIAVRTSPNGETVVVLCQRGQVLLLDSATGKCRAEHQAFGGGRGTHGFVIRERIRFSPRGDQFAVWGCHDAAEVRKTSTGELSYELRHRSGFIHDVQFSPNGRLVATCSSDSENSVRLWDAITGASSGPPLSHAGWVFSAQFSHDSRRLLTASSDKQARIWDVATGKAILATREHTDQVFGVTFLPGEELFLAAARDGKLTAWDASLGKMIAPARWMPSKVFQLSRSELGHNVIASGELRPSRGFDWSRWILDPDMQLSREDVKLLGEILSSQRVHEAGAATRLTSAQWLERWNVFRQRHPDSPALQMPPLKSSVE